MDPPLTRISPPLQEVPNPVMPPPRRFSAAPTLTCPHRNKSSSHSSSSLHHTYSIDSSESMITVILANRGQEYKRSSRGSLSCNSGQGLDSSGSFYALPRSPLSPRSPSRCSPGLLTPNTSEPATTLEPPFSPATTNTTTCSSTGPPTVVYQTSQISKRSPEEQANVKPQVHPTTSIGNVFNLSAIQTTKSPTNTSINSCLIDEDNLSTAVDHEVSLNSTRNDLNGDNLNGSDTDAATDVDEDEVDTLEHNSKSNAKQTASDLDPNTPIIDETINEFCAKHSREELEFLIAQISYLKISDCYFSQKSSTLCIVIEVNK